MKLTVLNVGRFWHRLMFPPITPTYHLDRLSLRMDLPWEPWLHCSMWLATVLTLIMGEKDVMPPIDGLDWYWLIGGLVAPPLGFFSAWTLAHYKGRSRYIAIWTRMVADLVLAVSMALYQLDRFDNQKTDIGLAIIPSIVLFFAMWFTFALVWRDIKFIISTERLAALIYHDVREVTLGEWVEWVDDAA